MPCASTSTKTPPLLRSERKRRWRKGALAAYRLGVIAAALACLRALPEKDRGIDTARLLAEVRAVFPGCISLGDRVDGLFPLLGERGETLGWATGTYPQAEAVQGYSGPSEALVVFDARRTVKAVRLLDSADTAGHVRNVRDDAPFWSQWDGRSEASLGAPGKPRVVTGATLTSEAIARGVAARFGAEGMDQWFPDPLAPATVAKWYPGADRIGPLAGAGTYRVSKGESTMGIVLRSSRMGVSARGFNGASDVIVNLDAEGRTVLGIGFLGSRDNEPYIDDVAEELKYADGFAGRSVDEILASDPERSGDLFVSGASVTTAAVVESVVEMLRRHRAEEPPSAFPWKTCLAFAWIGAGIFLGLGKKPWKAKLRLPYALASVAAGLTLGWLVGQDQILGWARGGLDPKAASPLLALTAAALTIPAFTGKNVYCARICPHGAAQALAGLAIKKRFVLPRRIHLVMERVPWLTLIAIWALAFAAAGVPLACFEPFETWSGGFVAFLPAAIFTVGLAAAFFLPQAYCHYGCPTGALLNFLARSPSRWTAKDTAAGGLVAVAAVFLMIQRG